MAKIGAKELAQRELHKRKLSRAHEMMIEDRCPEQCLRTGPGPKPKRAKEVDPGVTLAPPLSVQKAIAADLAENETETTPAPADAAANPEESAMTTKSKKNSKKSAKSKARTAVKSNTVAADSKKAKVLEMLKAGATMDALREATGWTAHSVHGLIGSIRSKMKLKVVATKEKDVNVYRIAA